MVSGIASGLNQTLWTAASAAQGSPLITFVAIPALTLGGLWIRSKRPLIKGFWQSFKVTWRMKVVNQLKIFSLLKSLEPLERETFLENCARSEPFCRLSEEKKVKFIETAIGSRFDLHKLDVSKFLSSRAFVMGDLHNDLSMFKSHLHFVDQTANPKDIFLYEGNNSLKSVMSEMEKYSWDNDLYLRKTICLHHIMFEYDQRMKELPSMSDQQRWEINYLDAAIKRTMTDIDKESMMYRNHRLVTRLDHFRKTYSSKQIFVQCGKAHLEAILYSLQNQPDCCPLYFKEGIKLMSPEQYFQELIQSEPTIKPTLPQEGPLTFSELRAHMETFSKMVQALWEAQSLGELDAIRAQYMDPQGK